MKQPGLFQHLQSAKVIREKLSFHGKISFEVGSGCHGLEGSVYAEEDSNHCNKQFGVVFRYCGLFVAMKWRLKNYEF